MVNRKYGVCWRSVKRIKDRITWKQYTQGLGPPGDIVVWGLTEQERREICWYPYNSEITAEKYGITTQTVRNIRRQYYPMPKDMSKIKYDPNVDD